MNKIVFFIGLLSVLIILSGCTTSSVVLENPGSCAEDSDCVGIIHPAGVSMCVGEHWMEQGGQSLVKVDEKVICECIDTSFPLPELVGLKHGNACQIKSAEN